MRTLTEAEVHWIRSVFLRLGNGNRDPANTEPQWLGEGLCSDVWGVHAFAFKLYCESSRGLPVAAIMREEIDTYRALKAAGEKTGLPRLHHFEEPSESQGRTLGICGLAVFDRAPGRTMMITEIRGLGPDLRGKWVRELVARVTDVERTLALAPTLPNWSQTYAQRRLARLQQMLDVRHPSETSDLALFRDLQHMVEASPSASRFIHGDVSPGNIVTNLADETVVEITLIDPLVAADRPESNWRHFTTDKPLVELLIDAYERETKTKQALPMVFAYGAMTWLYLAAVREFGGEPATEYRRNLETCLAEL